MKTIRDREARASSTHAVVPSSKSIKFAWSAGALKRLAIISYPTCLQTCWPRHPIIGADMATHASPLGPML